MGFMVGSTPAPPGDLLFRGDSPTFARGNLYCDTIKANKRNTTVVFMAEMPQITLTNINGSLIDTKGAIDPPDGDQGWEISVQDHPDGPIVMAFDGSRRHVALSNTNTRYMGTYVRIAKENNTSILKIDEDGTHAETILDSPLNNDYPVIAVGSRYGNVSMGHNLIFANVQIHNIARSEDWVHTEHNNINLIDSFFNIDTYREIYTDASIYLWPTF